MESRILIEITEMTIDEYAKKVGVTEDTVKGWVKTGKLPTFKVGKRRMINLVARAHQCLQMAQFNDKPQIDNALVLEHEQGGQS